MQRVNPEVESVLQLLCQRWPACFFRFEQRRKPLKINIHEDILTALGDSVIPAALSKALRVYVANAVYRSRLVAGAVRFDLDGRQAGTVTVEQATHARSRSKAKPQTQG
jgi:ProP effector